MPKHYHVHEGPVGCIPDSCTYHTSKREAYAEAARRAREMREIGYHVKGTAQKGYACNDGIAYIEVVECDDSTHRPEDYD